MQAQQKKTQTQPKQTQPKIEKPLEKFEAQPKKEETQPLEPSYQNSDSYTVKFPDGTTHTFYWWKQECYTYNDQLYSNINGTIYVYDLTKLNPTNGNYQLLKTIQYRSSQTPMIYPETILTPQRNNFFADIEQNYNIMKQTVQAKQFQDLDPTVAVKANILTPQELNTRQTYNFQYNQETRQLFDGFDSNQVEFAHDF